MIHAMLHMSHLYVQRSKQLQIYFS